MFNRLTVAIEELSISFEDSDGKPSLSVAIESKNAIRRNKSTDLFVELHNLMLGVTSEADGIITLAVTGYRNVYRFIAFLQEKKIGVTALEPLMKKCKAHLDSKENQYESVTVPFKAKQVSQFEKVRDLHFDERSYPILRKQKDGNNARSLYVFKESWSDRSDSDIEVFNGLCYRLLLNDQYPKTKGLYNGKVRSGMLSKYAADFQSFGPYEVERSSLSVEGLVSTEVIKVMAASLLEKENDLHLNNLGINKNRAMRIDVGRSEWPITSRYLGIHPVLPFPSVLNDEQDNPISIPSASFRLTPKEIINFPYLSSTKVARWPTLSEYVFHYLPDAMDVKKFRDDKYFTFLKRALIPDSVYEAIGLATVKSNAKRAQIVKAKCARTRELKVVLMRVNEFWDYLDDNEGLIDKVIADFEKYNADYKKERDKSLKVDLEQIKENFKRLKAAKPAFFQRHIFLRDVLIGLGVLGGSVGVTVAMMAVLSVAIPSLGLSLAGLLVAGSVALTVIAAITLILVVPLVVFIVHKVIENCYQPAYEMLDLCEQKEDVKSLKEETETTTVPSDTFLPESVWAFPVAFFKKCFSSSQEPTEATPLKNSFSM